MNFVRSGLSAIVAESTLISGAVLRQTINLEKPSRQTLVSEVNDVGMGIAQVKYPGAQEYLPTGKPESHLKMDDSRLRQ